MNNKKIVFRFSINKTFKAGSLLGLLVIGIAVGSLMVYQVQDVIVEQSGNNVSRRWRALGDANPGGDNSGFMYGMTWKHAAAPGTTYASNLSNSSADCYEYSDSLNGEMTGETPHSTAFDFLCKFRVNDTVGYNTSSGQWEPDWLYNNISVDFDYASDVSLTSMTLVEIGNNSDFAWYQGYINNGGSGYIITHNEKFNITQLSLVGYY